MNTESTDDFLKSLAVISQHIEGMKQDYPYLVKQLIEPFLAGLGYDQLGKLIEQAPNFTSYKWQEFEQGWEPPKLRKKNATPEEITAYQHKKRSESLGYEIAVCISRHAYFRRNLRQGMDTDKDLNKLMPYMKININGEAPESFPFVDGQLVKPNDPKLKKLTLGVSLNLPSIHFSRHRINP